jgi:hypothetical protein
MSEQKQCYNYKHVFDEPIKIRQLTDNFSLPFAIRLDQIVLAVVIFALEYFLFKGLINFLNGFFGGFKYILYLGFPYFLSQKILALNPDGQKLSFYIKDLFLFIFLIQLPKVKYCNDKKLEELEKGLVIFEKFYG